MEDELTFQQKNYIPKKQAQHQIVSAWSACVDKHRSGLPLSVDDVATIFTMPLGRSTTDNTRADPRKVNDILQEFGCEIEATTNEVSCNAAFTSHHICTRYGRIHGFPMSSASRKPVDEDDDDDDDDNGDDGASDDDSVEDLQQYRVERKSFPMPWLP